jgi:hypothetical protein
MEVLDVTVTVWQLVAGGLFMVILLVSLIKAVI